MQSEPFDFIGGDGSELSGQLDLPDGPTRAFAIFAHCFTCTKQSLAAVRIGRALAAHGIGVLRFDFTGLGEGELQPSIDTFSGNVRDITAASQAMSATGKPPRLLIGHSLGGAAVLAAAAHLAQVVAIATIAAPFDVEHVKGLLGEQLKTVQPNGDSEITLGDRTFRVGRDFVSDLADHDQAGRLGRLDRALLVLHAPADQVVDIENAAQIFMAARHPKSFVSLDDADHLLSRPSDAEYVGGIITQWASRYLPAASH